MHIDADCGDILERECWSDVCAVVVALKAKYSMAPLDPIYNSKQCPEMISNNMRQRVPHFAVPCYPPKNPTTLMICLVVQITTLGLGRDVFVQIVNYHSVVNRHSVVRLESQGVISPCGA